MDETLIQALEERLNRLADRLRDLTRERDGLREEVGDRGEHVALLEEENASLVQQLTDLKAERERTVKRVEALIERLDGLDA